MASTYEPLATTTLSSAAASITFSSIPSTYTDLRVVMTATATSAVFAAFQFNGDTGSNYSYTAIYGDGTTAAADFNTNLTSMFATIGGFNTTIPGLLTADIFSYTGSTNKTALITHSKDTNGSGFVSGRVGLWRNTAAITQLTIISGASFNTGTTATLYGIKNA